MLDEVVFPGASAGDALAAAVLAAVGVQRQPFDVILAYFVYPAGYLATVLGELLGVPVVCSCRGNDISKEMFITPEIIAAVLTRSTRLIFVSASLLHMADTLTAVLDHLDTRVVVRESA